MFRRIYIYIYIFAELCGKNSPTLGWRVGQLGGTLSQNLLHKILDVAAQKEGQVPERFSGFFVFLAIFPFSGPP